MLFDLTNTAFTVYFDGDLYQGVNQHYLQLTSLYNNNGILNNQDTGDGVNGMFNLDIVAHNERYTQCDVDFTNTDLQTFDIEGVYQWVIFYDNAVIQYGMCKVVNGSEESGTSTTTQYMSDNEYNEQYTFYK